MTDIQIDRLRIELQQKEDIVADMRAQVDQAVAQTEAIYGANNALVILPGDAMAGEPAGGTAELAARHAAIDRDPRQINAEDAFDTILRLESTLKVAKERNHLLKRANEQRHREVTIVQRALLKSEKELDKLVYVSGYNGEYEAETAEHVQSVVDGCLKMQAIMVDLRRELRNADVIIKRKRDLMASLRKDLDVSHEKEAVLCQVYNDVRVVDREVQEKQQQLDLATQTFNQSESVAVTLYGNRDHLALRALESDREFMKAEVKRHREDRLQQSRLVSAQLARTRQLEARLEVVMEGVRDMRMEKDLERAIGAAHSAPLPAPGGDATDIDRILPPHEEIPIELYELLHRDAEAMHSICDRKLILKTEKSNTIDAQEAFLAGYKTQLALCERQQNLARTNGKIEAEEGHVELAAQHAQFREELGRLVLVNTQLKSLERDLKSGSVTAEAATKLLEGLGAASAAAIAGEGDMEAAAPAEEEEAA